MCRVEATKLRRAMYETARIFSETTILRCHFEMWLANARANREQREREKRAFLWRREHLQQDAIMKLMRAAIVIQEKKNDEIREAQSRIAEKTWDRVARIARHWRSWTKKRVRLRREMDDDDDDDALIATRRTYENDVEENDGAELRGAAALEWSRHAMKRTTMKTEKKELFVPMHLKRRRHSSKRLVPCTNSNIVFDSAWSPGPHTGIRNQGYADSLVCV